MGETKEDAAVVIVLGAMVIVLMPFGIIWETWVALKLWAWFAPWPLALSLMQATGVNLVVSLVVRHASHAKDERTSAERCGHFLAHAFVGPLVFLGVGAILRSFL